MCFNWKQVNRVLAPFCFYLLESLGKQGLLPHWIKSHWYGMYDLGFSTVLMPKACYQATSLLLLWVHMPSITESMLSVSPPFCQVTITHCRKILVVVSSLTFSLLAPGARSLGINHWRKYCLLLFLWILVTLFAVTFFVYKYSSEQVYNMNSCQISSKSSR